MISDEIGKYPAFSSIGADEDYDRYSWITNFVMDPQNIQETRNDTIYPYKGQYVLDDDIVYNGRLYPRRGAVIIGFLIPMKVNDEGELTEMKQPTAVLFYNGKQERIPLECVFFDGEEIVFEEGGLDGCFRIIPTIEGNQLNLFGGGLYLSGEVRKTLFTSLYLYGLDSSNFEEVYNDEQNMPLSIYSGRLIGPLKIWKINYPEGIEKNPVYLEKEVPDEAVLRVDERYS
jgi:hypothetical protein